MVKRAVVLILSGALLALIAIGYVEPARLAQARSTLAALWSNGFLHRRMVVIRRTDGGEFTLTGSINGVRAPMVLDTGATSVILTHETAKAIGLPLALLNYDIDIETANGRTRAAAVTLDSLAIGRLAERAVPALVVPRGALKTSLLGMSFLDRLESWEVRGDKVLLRGYP